MLVFSLSGNNILSVGEPTYPHHIYKDGQQGKIMGAHLHDIKHFSKFSSGFSFLITRSGALRDVLIYCQMLFVQPCSCIGEYHMSIFFQLGPSYIRNGCD